MSGYETIGILASGGMGQVELAIRSQGAFRRMYALKRLKPEHRSNPEFRDMFIDEGRVAGLIRHPNVVSVHDFGEDEEGPFLVMDLVDGVDGRTFMARHKELGTKVPQQIATRIAADTAAGLVAAHELVGLDGRPLGLIHRDVSPQNLMIGFDGVTRVTDFGIAKAYGRLAETSTGLLKGKVGYMAPEQLRFEEAAQRSDLFALGVVMYEVLACKRLYRSSTPFETARKILNDPAPDIFAVRDDAHPALVELLFELLAKDPNERPETAREVAERLQNIAEDMPAEEGVLSVDAYVQELFADSRRQMAEHRERLVRGLEEGGATVMLDPQELQAELDEAPTNMLSRGPNRWLAATVAVASAAILAVLGAALANNLKDEPSSATTDEMNATGSPAGRTTEARGEGPVPGMAANQAAEIEQPAEPINEPGAPEPEGMAVREGPASETPVQRTTRGPRTVARPVARTSPTSEPASEPAAEPTARPPNMNQASDYAVGF